MNSFTWECIDGKIIKGMPTVIQDCRIKPHEGTSCLIRVANLSIDHRRSTSDSSYLASTTTAVNNEIKVQIGLTSVTPIDRLLDICITTMQKEETSDFEIEASEDNGRVTFTATLLEFEDCEELYALADEKKLNIALQLKNDGVELFRRDKIKDAFNKFSKALKYLILIEEESLKFANMDLRTTLECNIGGCHISQKNYHYTIELCNSVLAKEPNNIKALYRRGCALLELNEFSRSKTDLSKALILEPQNQAVKSKMSLLHQRDKVYSDKLAQAMQKMFT